MSRLREGPELVVDTGTLTVDANIAMTIRKIEPRLS